MGKVDRAKRQVREWQERWDQECWERLGDHLAAYSSTDLIKVAETGKDIDGRTLQPQEWLHFDYAWKAKFGEHYFEREDDDDGSAGDAGNAPEPATDPGQHPILALPDGAMVRSRQLASMLGLSKATLKRWRRAGKVPPAQEIAPGSGRIGWPARQLKAWLRMQDGETAGRT